MPPALSRVTACQALWGTGKDEGMLPGESNIRGFREGSVGRDSSPEAGGLQVEGPLCLSINLPAWSPSHGSVPVTFAAALPSPALDSSAPKPASAFRVPRVPGFPKLSASFPSPCPCMGCSLCLQSPSLAPPLGRHSGSGKPVSFLRPACCLEAGSPACWAQQQAANLPSSITRPLCPRTANRQVPGCQRKSCSWRHSHQGLTPGRIAGQLCTCISEVLLATSLEVS